MKKEIKPAIIIENKIYSIRGKRVMLDRDLAEIYRVTTSNLNLAVKRNRDRFPEDFMFQITKQELKNLILQSATSSWGGSRHLPHAFTEHGVAMLSSVLNSKKAVQMNIYIIRAFIKLREVLLQDKDFELRITDMEFIQALQGKDIEEILERLRYLTRQALKPLGPMGFEPK